MKKRILALVSATILVFAMNMSVMAAGSPNASATAGQVVQNVQKAKNSVGGLAVPGGQILTDPVEGAVDDAVAVQYQQSIHSHPSFAECSDTYIITHPREKGKRI